MFINLIKRVIIRASDLRFSHLTYLFLYHSKFFGKFWIRIRIELLQVNGLHDFEKPIKLVVVWNFQAFEYWAKSSLKTAWGKISCLFYSHLALLKYSFYFICNRYGIQKAPESTEPPRIREQLATTILKRRICKHSVHFFSFTSKIWTFSLLILKLLTVIFVFLLFCFNLLMRFYFFLI